MGFGMKKENTRKLESRKDLAQLLLDWIRPLKGCYSEGRAMLHVGHTAAHYGEKSVRMEGYSRVLWGVGPLLATDNRDLSDEMMTEVSEWNHICLEGLIHGTDPVCEEYWGDVYDYDQKMVEMAAIVTTLLLAPDKMWEPLQPEQKCNVRAWLNQINGLGVHPNNWRFFRILVNVFFTVQGLEPDAGRLEEDLQVIENCYDGDGWYYDGTPKQMDYYIPFAMHYYSLLYAHFMRDADGERCERFLERAKLFYKDYSYWFSQDGSSVPFGRSLTYRFAHSAFFSAYALAEQGMEESDYGEAKGMLLRNLRYWAKQPIFDMGGILSIGYGYPNLFMSEKYNGPGSPYWSFKAFLALAIPAEHPFWQAKERELTYEEKVCLTHPHMLVTHEGDHVQLYPVGQFSSVEHGNCASKYAKFVYSNRFGFSVSRGTTLESGAFDNTLAVSAQGENCYRMRTDVDSFEVTPEYNRSRYHMGKRVQVESVIVPMGAWHVRIHKIHTTEAIDVAEGGYAIAQESCGMVVPGSHSGKYTWDMVQQDELSLFCNFPWGVSGIVGEGIYDGVVADTKEADAGAKKAAEQQSPWSPRLVTAFPNTNVLHNLTVIPTLCTTLEPGEHILVSCVYAHSVQMPKMEQKPQLFAEKEQKRFTVEKAGKRFSVSF